MYVVPTLQNHKDVQSLHRHQKLYLLLFGCLLGDQRAPHVVCKPCSTGLRNWVLKKKRSMPFAISVIWWEPKNHTDDCYFSCVKIKGFSEKKNIIIYPNIESSLRLVPHEDNLPRADRFSLLWSAEKNQTLCNLLSFFWSYKTTPLSGSWKHSHKYRRKVKTFTF